MAGKVKADHDSRADENSLGEPTIKGDLLTDMLIFAFPYIEHDDEVMKFDLCFPCTTFESFAIAVLEVVPADAHVSRRNKLSR